MEPSPGQSNNNPQLQPEPSVPAQSWSQNPAAHQNQQPQPNTASPVNNQYAVPTLEQPQPAIAATSVPQQQLIAQVPTLPTNPSKKLAIATLVLGIIGFLTGFLGIGILLGLVAVILGTVSLAKHAGGKGLAITGLVFGAVALLFGPFATLVALGTVSGLQRAAEVENQQIQAIEEKKQSQLKSESGGGTLDCPAEKVITVTDTETNTSQQMCQDDFDPFDSSYN